MTDTTRADAQHLAAKLLALKKVLAAGKRGAKDDAKDVQEAIDSLQRWQVMREEDDAVRRAPVADCQNTDGAHLYRDKFDVLRRAAPRPEVPHHVPGHTRQEMAEKLPPFPVLDQILPSPSRSSVPNEQSKPDECAKKGRRWIELSNGDLIPETGSHETYHEGDEENRAAARTMTPFPPLSMPIDPYGRNCSHGAGRQGD